MLRLHAVIKKLATSGEERAKFANNPHGYLAGLPAEEQDALINVHNTLGTVAVTPQNKVLYDELWT